MHLIVTGASGFVGTRLIQELADAGHGGIATSRTRIERLARGWQWMDRCNLSDPIREGGSCSIDAPAGVDAVIHLEVKQHVLNPTPRDVAEFESVNVEGTRFWLEWCGRHDVRRFILFSTIKAVGESLQVLDETATATPSTAYGRSKRAAERLALAWADASPDRSVIILRPSVVYGPGNQANMFSFVHAIASNRFFLIGQNANIKSLVSIKNLICATEYLLRRMKPGAEIVNIVDARSYSVRELARIIARILNVPCRARALPLILARTIARAGDLYVTVTGRGFPLTTSRLNALLETTHFSSDKLLSAGFRHPQSTEEGLREMIAWYKERAPSFTRS